ncbi:hypothetical protein [Halobiforma nitratireducens]|uniref:Uncharacterized protein n=1 Tax=Halobiforma nitratireducens JCM 10879 TaxID=1227454 RepID=M0MAW6_9EURY|nr:hypothetical protein [Halobiforma nitratireducens]EMA42932.1 hypothetical protein C446_03761 [Halobiforma nitratireducens JCM 10879]
MNRRTLLRGTAGGVGLLLGSGCTGADFLEGDAPGGDPEPQLPPEERIREVLEGDEWEQNDESITAPLADEATHLTAFSHDPDDDEMASRVDADSRADTAGRVQLLVWEHDDSDDTTERYEAHPDQQRDLEEFEGMVDVATESVAGGVTPSDKPTQVRVLFRDANAVGWVSYWTFRNQSYEEYGTTAVELAEVVHDHWHE